MPIRVFQNNFSGGEISPAMHSRVDLDKYATCCDFIENGVVHPHGGVSKRGGTYYVDELPGPAYLISFTYRVEQAYVLAFYDNPAYTGPSDTTHSPGLMRVYAEGAPVTSGGSPLVVNCPYSLAEAKVMSTVQSADTLFIAHPRHKPRKLVRASNTSWSFSEMTFAPGIAAPAAPTLTASGFSGDNTRELKYQVSAVSSTDEESYPSTAASITVPKDWTAGAKVTVTWATVTGAVRYNVYKNERGWYGWVATIEAADGLSFIDDNVGPASGDGPKTEGLTFSAAGEYPGAVGIYQQRLVFARSNQEPQTIWCSQSGALNNFSTSYPLKDTDSITAAMDSRQMNEIRHLYLLKNQLVVLTAGAEWMMGPGRNADAVTPTNVHFQNQSFYGCSTVPPLQAGGALLLLQNSGKLVRDLYSTYTDEYEGNEVSIMAEHLFRSPVVDWVWQEEPYHTAYAVREDGALLTFTYLREQKLSAWSHHATEGKFLSVSCIRENLFDRVYTVVERDLNGVKHYFVEEMMQREYGENIADGVYLDCALSYSGAATTTLTGLTHLANCAVVALADGGEVDDLVVSAGGTLTLPFPASRVHVGLPYTFTIRTLDPELNGRSGSTAGLRKNVVKAVLRVREARALYMGPDDEHLSLVKFPLQADWEGEPPAPLGMPPALFSGDIDVVLQGRYRREATVTIRDSAPLPATILSLNLTVNTEDS